MITVGGVAKALDGTFPIKQMMNFALEMMNFVLKMMHFGRSAWPRCCTPRVRIQIENDDFIMKMTVFYERNGDFIMKMMVSFYGNDDFIMKK